MAEVIRMPRMSPTMEEGIIAGWLKKIGDPIKVGDILCEVETDKATMELESFQAGTLLHIGVEKGAIPVDAILAILGAPGEDFSALLGSPAAAVVVAAGSPPAEAVAPAVAAPSSAAATNSAAPILSENGDNRLKASPLAKSMAKETGVNITSLRGSGDEGRIVKRDVEAAMQTQVNVAPAPAPIVRPAAPAPLALAGDIDIPVSQMRKTIARRLAESKFSAPHFYLTIEISMDEAAAVRAKLNETAPVKISYNDLVIKAVASSLRHHPAINSSWLGDVIRRNARINIGVAVAVEDGLLVPVVMDADTKSLSQINIEVKDKATRAKDKKLGLDEMQGNTFTISNLGMFDIDEFTAIINPPDACILAIGSIAEKPVVKEGQIVVGKVLKVTLSCDHRVVDGATAALFLQTFKANLESPIRMLV